LGLGQSSELATRSIDWSEITLATGLSSPLVQLMEHDLAYIMYTSGSTGNPKGMMHTHSSGLAYTKMAVKTYDVGHADRLSNHSPLHFDMSTFDYFAGPLAGATTVIIPEAYTKLPASLSKLIADEQLTIWYSVPFALIQLLMRGILPSRDLSALRWILFGGEPFTPGHLRALQRLLPTARFSNVYGPAEVNQCTYYHVPPLADNDEQPVPIGMVCENVEGLVVDEADAAVAAGEVGELLIRAPTMMRGYWGRPDLNERAFYRRQVFPNYEDVFYRTGDLVQEAADGNLKFLGRKDRQVKTRGYRVELDEVEHALASHPHVEENAVYAVPDAEGSSRIEAAVLACAGVVVHVDTLQQYLTSLLPWYAVPATIIVMEEFPRTGSGKIDRRALRERAIAAQETLKPH
jgi:amino acid adenylation domain-containing protein